jgi:glycosyltransferase involved in cell wall biosynthesis
MRPKVLIVVNADYFFVSHRLAIGKALREAGYEVVVAAGETSERKNIEDAGLRFVALPITRGGQNPLQEAKVLRAIIDLYRREKPDVVHHVSIKPVLYGTLAARILGVPAIVNAISGLGFVFIERTTDGPKEKAIRLAARAAYRTLLRAPRTRVIFQNPDDRGAFIDAGFVDPKDTVLIRGSGVDTKRFKPSPLPEGETIVMMPTRLLWDKGIGEYVEAARSLKGKARFVVVGWIDPDNPAVVPKDTVDGWVDEGAIEWWGPRHRDEMPATLAQAHLIVLPSYREGLPLTLAEAAATGRASVTTDVPGCREIVRHGENGWLVPVRDARALAQAIEHAITDREELRRRSERGRVMAEEEFAQTLVVKRTLDVYRQLVPLPPKNDAQNAQKEAVW